MKSKELPKRPNTKDILNKMYKEMCEETHEGIIKLNGYSGVTKSELIETLKSSIEKEYATRGKK